MSVMILALAVFAMTSCSSSDFSCETQDDKNMTVTATNAGDDMETLSGGIVVEEGEQIMIESALESGEIQLEFIPQGDSDADASLDEIVGDPVLTTTVGVGESFSAEVGTDSYYVRCSVIDKATGTINISVAASESAAADWIEAASTDEAGEQAGVGLFLCDPQGTSLGQVTNSDFHYMQGVAEAHYGLGAVSLTVHKALPSVNNGDPSFDSTNYANEWMWIIDDTEITCFGNREGEATKSIWTKGDYAYSITAYGEGGDTDYGLSEEDLTTIFKDLQ